jgi:hypothetical protein
VAGYPRAAITITPIEARQAWGEFRVRVRIMEDNYFGFDPGKLAIGILKLLKEKGLLDEKAILDLLWEVKDPKFPWSKSDIKELLKL